MKSLKERTFTKDNVVHAVAGNFFAQDEYEKLERRDGKSVVVPLIQFCDRKITVKDLDKNIVNIVTTVYNKDEKSKAYITFDCDMTLDKKDFLEFAARQFLIREFKNRFCKNKPAHLIVDAVSKPGYVMKAKKIVEEKPVRPSKIVDPLQATLGLKVALQAQIDSGLLNPADLKQANKLIKAM